MTNGELQEELKKYPDWVPILINVDGFLDSMEPIMQQGPSADGIGAIQLNVLSFEE